MTESHALDHVGLNVADLPAMTSWYGAALGLEVEFEFALEHVRLLRRDAPLPARLSDRAAAPPGNVAGMQAANPVEAALTRASGTSR